MKTLKLDHKLATLVRQGEKTATWRIYDDKDISVNDEVELVDKIDPINPDTWEVIGIARVNLVVEKRLGDVTEEDMDGHEPFVNRDEMLTTYQKYYGPQISFETPVKMIHFSFTPKEGARVDDVVGKTSRLIEAKLYADGGSRGNPGPSASGYVILDMNDNIALQNGIYLGITTNNQAEYQALKLGLEEARKLGIRQVHVYMDSLLVVNQMLGKFKVKNRDLWPIHESIKQLVPSFKKVTFTHVPRELNKLADAEVNIALDAAAQAQAQ